MEGCSVAELCISLDRCTGDRGFRAPIRSRLLFITSAVFLLASCDGNSGSVVTPPPPPVNLPPVITSAATVTSQEGQTAPFYNVTATDAEGATLTFAISGGADAARFQLDARGALSFRAAPDFESPIDEDRNNIYLVQLVAGDGQNLSAALNLQVTVADTPGGPLRVRQIATGLVAPTELTSLPDGRLLISQTNDQVRVVDPTTGTIAVAPFLDVSPEGQQLNGLVLSPNFSTDRTVYVTVRKNEPAPSSRSIAELRRYRAFANDISRIDQSSYEVVLASPTRRDSGYNIGQLGQMAFGPDGFLYVNFPLKDDQIVETAIQRIDPTGDDFPDDTLRNFRIPSGNPGRCRPELWAFGLLNPDSLAIDSFTGFLWTMSDQGRDYEVNLIRPAEAGSNYGEMANTCGDMVGPVHSSYIVRGMFDQSANLVGGVIYRGPLEALQGRYIYGSSGIQVQQPPGPGPFKFPYVSSILTVGARPGEEAVRESRADITPTTAVGVYLNRIAQDLAGNVYLLYSNGAIYRVEAG